MNITEKSSEMKILNKLIKEYNLEKSAYFIFEGHVVSLEILYKDIGQIPQEIENLFHLKSLTLNHCKIVKIEHLDSLSNLEILALAYNKIKKIEGLDNLLNLEYLSLSGNQISKIEGLNLSFACIEIATFFMYLLLSKKFFFN